MQHLSSPAIVLRTIQHGDNDKILTFFTLDQGKVSLIAKGAQRSTKRFAGVLELFSAIHLVWTSRKPPGLPFLQEASIIHPFDQIRTCIRRTTHASCWCEMVHQWMEEGQAHPDLFQLLKGLLDRLNVQALPAEILHIAFQLRFMALNGFKPDLDACSRCGVPLDGMAGSMVAFHVRKGGLLCQACGAAKPGHVPLSKGTVKLLSWILNASLTRLERIRFSRRSIEEALRLLDAFVPYYLGRETKSAKMLNDLRDL